MLGKYCIVVDTRELKKLMRAIRNQMPSPKDFYEYLIKAEVMKTWSKLSDGIRELEDEDLI